MKYAPAMPMKVSDRVIRDAIGRFHSEGESGPHSPIGGILTHVLNHCIENQISFTLRYVGGGGYFLEKE